MSANLSDSGYNGRLKSLGGVIGKEGAGIELWSSTPAPTTTPVVVVDPNPRRMWVLITNEGTVDVQIAFDSSFSNGYHTLTPLTGKFVIDANLPWTGAVYAKTSAGTGLLGLHSAYISQV